MFRRRRPESVVSSAPVHDLLLLILPGGHESYLPAGHPFRDNDGIIIAPSALRAIPRQPDGGNFHRFLTQHPSRRPRSLLFMADLARDLDQARLSWADLGIDVPAVLEDVTRLAAFDEIEFVGVTMHPAMCTLVSVNSRTGIRVHFADGPATLGPTDRERFRQGLYTNSHADLAGMWAYAQATAN